MPEYLQPIRPLKHIKLSGLPCVYAIGDIHGCWAELQQSITAITQHAKHAKIAPTIIFLGDLIDRGPDSLKVWNWVHTNHAGMTKIIIDGNHEQMAEFALYGFGKVQVEFCLEWLRNGGMPTLSPLFQDPERLILLKTTDITKVQTQLKASHFSKHVNIIEWGRYVFTHASLEPNVPLTQQPLDSVLWSRSHRPYPNKVVIHGHTPNKIGPDLTETVINIDTGAYSTGTLCSIVVYPDHIERLT